MKSNFSIFSKAANFTIIAAFVLSFTVRMAVGCRFQAKLFPAGSAETRSDNSGAGPTSTPAPAKVSATQGWGQLHQKASLERLIQLMNTSGVNGTLSKTTNLAKLDSHLQDLVSAQLGKSDVAAAAHTSGIRLNKSQAALVDIYVHGALPDAVSQLKALGMQVLATNVSFGGVVEGYLPVNSMVAAASLQQTKALMPVIPPILNTGSVTSEGDGAMNGPDARMAGAVDGSGVTVGIISDSMNEVGTGVAGSQASGDLPANVVILNDDPLLTTDEGRAMGEVMYDTAPGISSMYFDTADGGAATKAAHISELVNNGVKIIADDTTYLSEPFFQDGMVAQAVDSAYNSGVAYIRRGGQHGPTKLRIEFR